jgi:hypothetical protein
MDHDGTARARWDPSAGTRPGLLLGGLSTRQMGPKLSKADTAARSSAAASKGVRFLKFAKNWRGGVARAQMGPVAKFDAERGGRSPAPLCRRLRVRTAATGAYSCLSLTRRPQRPTHWRSEPRCVKSIRSDWTCTKGCSDGWEQWITGADASVSAGADEGAGRLLSGEHQQARTVRVGP